MRLTAGTRRQRTPVVLTLTAAHIKYARRDDCDGAKDNDRHRTRHMSSNARIGYSREPQSPRSHAIRRGPGSPCRATRFF